MNRYAEFLISSRPDDINSQKGESETSLWPPVAEPQRVKRESGFGQRIIILRVTEFSFSFSIWCIDAAEHRFR